MKACLPLLFLLIGTFGLGQTALYNQGNLRIHENGQIGFHTDLINDGTFDENLGLAGFYSNDIIDIYGAFPPTFFDVEFNTQINTSINTSVNVDNNVNFISGNVFTPRNQQGIALNFLGNAFYTGEGNLNKVDGYASITNQQDFIFPIGGFNQLRPLILKSEDINSLVKCAYFGENPNNPVSLNNIFNTDNKAADLGIISTIEFWRLEGSVTATIQISWNERSDLSALTDDVSKIIPVGWSKNSNQWVRLGDTVAVGDLTQGFVTSSSFIPNDYEVITFGAIPEPPELITLDNYLVSPNGDGINDFLEIPELEESPNNTLIIYDRFGLKVFEKANYTNEFIGFSNVDNIVINKSQGLPSGVYFYIASLNDLDLEFQGFLYLTVVK